MNIKEGKTILTHPGRAHRDEFLSCCLLMHLTGVPVTRGATKEGLMEALQDKTVIVVDMGEEHTPALNNYDHHQMKTGPPQCALTLILKTQRLYTLARQMWDWLEPTEILDVGGYKALAAWAEMPVAVKVVALRSPVEKHLIKQFSMVSEMHSGEPLYDIMAGIGEDLIEELEVAKRRVSIFHTENQIYDLDVGRVFRALPHNAQDNPRPLEIAIDRYFPDMEATIANDLHSDGWIVYIRDRNRGKWDFRCLIGEEMPEYIAVIARDGGAWLKTKRALDHDELNTLFNLVAEKTSV